MIAKTNDATAGVQSAVDIEAMRIHLSQTDPVLAVVHAAIEPFEWHIRQSGFVGLIRMIIEQQISVAAADAVWKKFEKGVGKVTAKNLLKFDIETLKSFGLSRPKAMYVRGIAEAVVSGTIDFAQLATLGDEEAVEKLTALKGVGRWTAEVYLMFCEGRTDLFPAGDLALQEGFRFAARKKHRPTEKALYARASRWNPYRGIAANMLWAYYRGVKSGTIEFTGPKRMKQTNKNPEK